MALAKIGGLWSKTGKNGGEFLSGKLAAENYRSYKAANGTYVTINSDQLMTGLNNGIMIFPVKTQKDRGPSHEIFVSVDEGAQAQTQEQFTTAEGTADDIGF